VLAFAAVGRNPVWFDDVGISAFHSSVVVDLWQSLSEWPLLLPKCVLLCRREYAELELEHCGKEVFN
jgi:hypothetical protein